jgi:ankyrin repeat protein
LLRAAQYGHVNIVKYLLYEVVNIKNLMNERDTDGRTALHYAALRNHIQVVMCLVEHGFNIDARDAVRIKARLKIRVKIRLGVSIILCKTEEPY